VKKSILFAMTAAMLLPPLVLAQSAFVGTWKADINNMQMPTKPDRYLLDKGVWHCLTCVPKVTVKADGMDHKVSGHPYYDTVSIKVIDDQTVTETDKKAGKTVTTQTLKVSADGSICTFEFSDSSASNGAPVVGKGESTRVAKGPTGAHAVSGAWHTTKFETVSDNGLIFSYALDGSTLKMSSKLGQSYAAPTDGSDVPYTGDPGITSVSVKLIDQRTFEETDKRQGKAIWIGRNSVSADGKTMTTAWKDMLHGTSGSFTSMKQ
jgi:hypothetical protein